MPMLNQVLRVEILDEDLLPGQKADDDDLIGRVDVMLEGVLRMDTPIREWFTLGDLSVPPSGPDGSQAQVELDISFYGAQERRLEKEAKLRKRRSTSGTVLLALSNNLLLPKIKVVNSSQLGVLCFAA